MKGYILKDEVRADRCRDCSSKSEVLARNFNDRNLILFGCRDGKCKNRLLRLEFDQAV